jgi:hypothetical protein
VNTDETAVKVLEHQLTADFVTNLGFLRWFSLGVDFPVAIVQSGDGATAESTSVLGSYSVPASAIGDLKVLGKVTIVQPTNQEFGGFALALHERFGIPTGNVGSFLGEGHVSSETRLLAEYRYVAVSIHGALGVRFRGEQERFGCAAVPEVDGEPGECPTTFGHEIPFGLSLALRPKALGIDDEGYWTWFVETFGYLPLYPEVPFTNASVSQVQLAGGARFSIDDFSLLAALDGAVVGGIGTPPIRATLALQWAPRVYDADEDTVEDEQDQCPELGEDLDGFEDGDGCPEWDNDDDTVPDGEDRCPAAKEDLDDFQDVDGCPDLDNDGEGILDAVDSCPDVPGIRSSDARQHGCPDFDPDRDGVMLEADRCPAEREDPDGFKDDDGCADPDNDGDGILDPADGCRDTAGVANPDPAQHGCPDQDGDGITDARDSCPAEAGVSSEEPAKHGCPLPPEPEPPPAGRPPARPPRPAGAR